MHKGIEVLLVDDDHGDVKLAKEALKRSKVMVNLHHIGINQMYGVY